MSKIWLASNAGNEHIDALLAAGEVQVDRLKVGPWMGSTVLTVAAATCPIILHISEGVSWPRSRGWVTQQVQLSSWLSTPWVSFHLEFGNAVMNFSWRWGQLIRRQTAYRWAVHAATQLAAQCPVKVLLENMSPSHYNCHPYFIDPTFITQVVQDADCHFLLDLAHARVAAELRDESVQDFILQLPLDRVIEIHVSGPRTSNGHLEDAHESLQADDYDLLTWVLSQTRPQAVTLEYWEEKAALKEQLLRLREIVDSAA